jgi:invasion protein IalB
VQTDRGLRVVALSFGPGPYNSFTIKVDDHEGIRIPASSQAPNQGDVYGQKAEKLVELFRGGREATIYVDSKYHANRAQDISLNGFSSAYARMLKCKD